MTSQQFTVANFVSHCFQVTILPWFCFLLIFLCWLSSLPFPPNIEGFQGLPWVSLDFFESAVLKYLLHADSPFVLSPRGSPMNLTFAYLSFQTCTSVWVPKRTLNTLLSKIRLESSLYPPSSPFPKKGNTFTQAKDFELVTLLSVL